MGGHMVPVCLDRFPVLRFNMGQRHLHGRNDVSALIAVDPVQPVRPVKPVIGEGVFDQSGGAVEEGVVR